MTTLLMGCAGNPKKSNQSLERAFIEACAISFAAFSGQAMIPSPVLGACQELATRHRKGELKLNFMEQQSFPQDDFKI